MGSVTSVHAPPQAVAAPPPRLEELLVRRFRPLVERGRGRAVVVAAATPAGDVVTSCGDAALGPGSIFEIGSITKPITGILLAVMAGAGEVALDDPVSRFLPARARGREITLRDLATHYAGLPRFPPNLVPRALRCWRDPCAGYTADDLLRALVRSRPGRPRYHYSNFGFGLLGHVVALAAGAAYERLVVERVCWPLGMTSTCVEVPPERRHLRATGHRWGRPVPPWNLGALVPAGGLRSTGLDLLRFLRANLAPEHTPLAGALEAAQADRAEIGPGRATIGLGWPHRVDGGRRLTWHHGATGGFRSVIAFDRAAGTGVAALANWGPLVGMPPDAAAFAALGDLVQGRPW